MPRRRMSVRVVLQLQVGIFVSSSCASGISEDLLLQRHVLHLNPYMRAEMLTPIFSTVTEANEVTVTVTSLPETEPRVRIPSGTLISDGSAAPVATIASAASDVIATSFSGFPGNETAFPASADTAMTETVPGLISAHSFTTTATVDAVIRIPSEVHSSAALEIAESTTTSTSTEPSVISAQNSTDASPAPSVDEFWAGACIGTVPRAEAIPGRIFYDYDGKTVKDPIKTLGDAGLNAFRVVVSRGQCLGPSQFVNDESTLDKERNYETGLGCIDLQVKLAQRSRAAGMKRFQLTINQGFNITKDMESFTYEQMIDDIKAEAKRQLQPFLDANLVPDIILFENEGTDGFLFQEESTGHIRGTKDGKAPDSKVDDELCGKYPTGKMNSYPQYSGYLKAEMNACNEAIKGAGFSTEAVRYGLHSHGQYVQWKEGFVHGPDQHSQSELKDSNGNPCPGTTVIPSDILSQNASEMLTIMGFSAYPDPMTPIDVNSPSSQNATLGSLRKTLDQMQGYAEASGRYTEGPFKGQWKLQGLGVEYATAFPYEQTSQEQELTNTMWETAKSYSSFLGMLWWEPWYCNNNWMGGQATLCRFSIEENESTMTPTQLLKTRGAAAGSPWL